MGGETDIGGAGREFPATRWTLILSSRENTQARRRAMEELLAVYWKPLYSFVRRKGLDRERAKDAVQSFMAQLLERDVLPGLEPERGRLRSYLRTAIKNHLSHLHEHASAAKRGGDAVTHSLDFDVAERGLERMPESPDAAFDREWAVGVMERATEKLRAEFEGGARGGPFELVIKFFRFDERPSYVDAAREHRMSIPQLKAFLHRARKRFRELLSEEIMETVGPDDVEAEKGELVRLLSS